MTTDRTAAAGGRQVLIVLANPEPRSFCHALAGTAASALAAAGHGVEVSDLYAQGFDPVAGRHDFTTVDDPERFRYQAEQARAAREGGFVPEIAAEQAKLRRADNLILVFPLWWGSAPAMLKGWLERVLAYGVAYVDGHRFDTGLLRGRRAMICVTTGGTGERFSQAGVYGPIEGVLYPVQRLALEYMGLSVEPPFVAYAAPRVADAERRAMLDSFAAQVVALAAKETDPYEPPCHPLDLVGEGAWTAS
jgi:NAD(P)H dehydrogenase (quinone)